MSAEMTLPATWIVTKLDNVTNKIVGGGTPSKNNPKYFEGNIPWMSVKDMNKHILDDTQDHISEEAVLNSSTNIIPAGIPIIATRMSLGKVIIAKFDSAINQDLKAIYLNDAISISYFTKWYRSVAKYIESLGTGTTVKGIRLENIKELDFPLTSLAEQHQIAQRLDELLAQVDTIKARLDAIPAILKRFRQSVLSAAVSGKLTEEWRKDNPDKSRKLLGEIRKYQREVWENLELQKFGAKKQLPRNDKWKEKYQEPSVEADVELMELPSSWSWGTWEDILDHSNAPFKRGPFGSALTKSIFVDKGYKVYEQYCPINDDCSYARYFISEDKYQELKAFDVQAKDFLISCSGVTLGRITQVPEQYEPGVINQALLRVRLDSNIYDDNFFVRMFRSEFFQKKIFDSSTGSAIPNVKGVKELKAIPVPIMTLDEQKEIVRLVDQYFTFAETIEVQVKNAKTRVDKLTQSILAKAFRGELTADWRAEHPELISGENSAEALLAKIQAAKAAFDGKKTRKKTI